MPFIQVIEITTTRPEEVEALVDQWRTSTEGERTAMRTTFAQDRARPNTFVQLVEFPSYDAAQANSALPATGRFAEQLARLCDRPPQFRDLDVRSVTDL